MKVKQQDFDEEEKRVVASVLLDSSLRFTLCKIINSEVDQSSNCFVDAVWCVENIYGKKQTRYLRLNGSMDTFVSLFRDVLWKNQAGEALQFLRDGVVQTNVVYSSVEWEVERVESEFLLSSVPTTVKNPILFSKQWKMVCGILFTFHEKLRTIFGQAVVDMGKNDEIATWVLGGEEGKLHSFIESQGVLEHAIIDCFFVCCTVFHIPFATYLFKSASSLKEWNKFVYDKRGNEIDMLKKKSNPMLVFLKGNPTDTPPTSIEKMGKTHTLAAGVVEEGTALVKTRTNWLSFDDSGLGYIVHTSSLENVLHTLPTPRVEAHRNPLASRKNNFWIYC